MVLGLVLLISLDCDIAYRRIYSNKLSNVHSSQLFVPRTSKFEFVDQTDGRVKTVKLGLLEKFRLWRDGSLVIAGQSVPRHLIFWPNTYDAQDLELIWPAANYMIELRSQVRDLIKKFKTTLNPSDAFMMEVGDFFSKVRGPELGHMFAILNPQYEKLINEMSLLASMYMDELLKQLASRSIRAQNRMGNILDDLDYLSKHGLDNPGAVERRLLPETIMRLPIDDLSIFFQRFSSSPFPESYMSEKENFSRIQALDRLRERIQIFIKHDPLGHLKSIQKSSARLYNAAKGIVLEYIDKSLRARALHLFPQNLRSASTSEIFDAFEEAERSLQPLRDYLRKMGAELSDPAFDPATNLERRL